MFNQEEEVNKIDLEKINSIILGLVKEVNLGHGMIIESTHKLAHFYSIIGFETEDGDKRAIIELSITAKMHGPHYDSEEYEEALHQIEHPLIEGSA